MTVSQVKSFLTDFRRMLEDMRSKLNSVQPDRFWEYDIVFNYFFRHFIHFDPARTDPIIQSQANEINYSADLLQTEGQTEGQTDGPRYGQVFDNIYRWSSNGNACPYVWPYM